jgi:UDP-N-acetyl-D-glucosamine dehydrogenase
MKNELIDTRQAKIGVIGLGYVGLPLILQFGKAGFPVVGLDVDQTKIDRLAKGESYIKHIPSADIRAISESGKLQLTTDFSIVAELDYILICVPTPLNKNREPDLRYILSTANQISPHLVKGKKQVIILESTTYPGTTQEILIPSLELSSDLVEGKDFYTAYSPEREDPNNKEFTTSTIPKVIGADSEYALAVTEQLYLSIIKEVVPVSDSRTAEATKLMENIFRSVNIALANELKTIFDKMGIDVWEVINAAKTKPFGFMAFYPGPGLGGHCIPIDPFYLTWKAREYGVTTRFIELAGEINVSMPEYVVQKILLALNGSKKSINGSRILIIGMAYKKNVDDARESPSYKIMDILTRQGSLVDYNDPFIPVLGEKRDYPQFVGKKGVPLENLGQYDITLILTDHSSYDYESLVEQSNIVVDTRNACAGIQSDKILKA